ncbi:MAG: phage tail sheath family protein, partial [Synergistaceae bacterium]|nr:phage tail sheath family protein [Synergistaceae bacterium]
FALFGVAPCVLINVLDPTKHKQTISPTDFTITDGEANLGQDVILANGVTFEGTTTYTAGVDYSLGYDDEGNAILSVLSGGKLSTASKVKVGFTRINPSAVNSYDIIGGVDATTGDYTGFELVNRVFPKFRLVPGLLGCPKWSEKPEVAAVMRAKAENVNGLFTCTSVVDFPSDSSGADRYTEVPEWKNRNNYMGTHEIACWPKVKLGDDVFHLSTQIIGLINKTDSGNEDTPYESPSNKLLQMNACVVGEGKELTLGLEEANYLNGQGVVTALNWVGGWRAWGNRTAAYPSNTDVKDCFIPVRRMFDWIGNEFILTFWQKVDGPMTPRLIRTILDSYNVRLNGLAARQYILGGRIEFQSTENPTTDLLDGILRFHLYISPPPPAEQIWAILEYDPSYLSVLFEAAA